MTAMTAMIVMTAMTAMANVIPLTAPRHKDFFVTARDLIGRGTMERKRIAKNFIFVLRNTTNCGAAVFVSLPCHQSF